jgi:hypothetical protein
MNTLKKLNYNQIIFDFKLSLVQCQNKMDDNYLKIAKKYDHIPVGWQQLEESNIRKYKEFNNEKIKLNAYGLLTGKKTGLTIIDFDDIKIYNNFIKYYPAFETCLRVKTRKGYHCYFKYSPLLKTASNILKNYNCVDCRNDGGFITIPPTKIKNENSELNTVYEEIDGIVEDLPDEFFELLNQKF